MLLIKQTKLILLHSPTLHRNRRDSKIIYRILYLSMLEVRSGDEKSNSHRFPSAVWLIPLSPMTMMQKILIWKSNVSIVTTSTSAKWENVDFRESEDSKYFFNERKRNIFKINKSTRKDIEFWKPKEKPLICRVLPPSVRWSTPLTRRWVHPPYFKFVKFTYLGSSISSTENGINT